MVFRKLTEWTVSQNAGVEEYLRIAEDCRAPEAQAAEEQESCAGASRLAEIITENELLGQAATDGE